MKKHVLGSLVSIAIAEVIGIIASVIVGNIKQVDSNLKQPPLNPEQWVFPVVWVILFALMGIAAYLVYKTSRHKNKLPLVLYAVQLIINFIWTIVFFGGNNYGMGVFIILVLDLIVVCTIIEFARVHRLAAYLMVPYLFWICFATYLTVGIWMMN